MRKPAFQSIAETQKAVAAFSSNYFPRPYAVPQIQPDAEYTDILGVRVSAINMKQALEIADNWISAGTPGYARVTSVHGIIEAQHDRRYRNVINSATFNLPDGMPLSWAGWLQGFPEMDRVAGPDFMYEMCKLSVEHGYRNYFYGGEPGVAELLKQSLQAKLPGLQVVGTYTPPFRPLTLAEEHEVIARIREARPDIVWIGLGAPKQEPFMAHFVDKLQVPLMFVVAAAFDYHTGRIRDCSHWVKRAGLQWLHRLAQDPRRLWKRYLKSNPAFLWHIAWQLSGLRRYPRE